MASGKSDSRSLAEKYVQDWIDQARNRRIKFTHDMAWALRHEADIKRLSRYKPFQEVAYLVQKKRVTVFATPDGEYDINDIGELYMAAIDLERGEGDLDAFLKRRKQDLEKMQDPKPTPIPGVMIPIAPVFGHSYSGGTRKRRR